MRRRKSPVVLGHQPAGTVVEVGLVSLSRLRRLSVLSRPRRPAPRLRLLPPGGRYVHRDTRHAPGSGGLAEFGARPRDESFAHTLKIPEGLPIEAGRLVEPLGNRDQSVLAGAIPSGTSGFLVIGLGIMGQMAVAIARRFGASRGAPSRPSIRERLEAASQFGAEEQIDVNRRSMSSMITLSTGWRGCLLRLRWPGRTTQAMEEGNLARGWLMLFSSRWRSRARSCRGSRTPSISARPPRRLIRAAEDTPEAMRLISPRENTVALIDHAPSS